MAQGQIKKGFFFYFGLFILLLFAVFMVCLVIMIFNPGKTVLWMQYFTDNTTYTITKTNYGSEKDIIWSDVSEVEINCSYADVIVERNASKDYTQDAIYIFNNAKGFTSSKNAVHFDYDVSFEDGKLTVDVTEPEGFMYFSKTINVILHASSLDNRQVNFQNIDLKINTGKGNVSLGGTYPIDDVTRTNRLKLRTADVSTGSGDIRVTDYFDARQLQGLKLKTESGQITANQAFVYNGKETKGLLIDNQNCDVSLTIDKGLISIDSLNIASTLEITNKRGNVVFDNVRASDVNFISCVQGNYVLGEVYSNIDFNSQDSILSPNVTIGKIHGDFVLYTKEGFKSAPNVTIDEVLGMLDVNSINGKLTVGKVSGAISVTSSDGLSVDVGVASENNNWISVINKDGDVKLNFEGRVSESKLSPDGGSEKVSGVTVKTERGNVTINVTNVAKFEANLYWNNLEKTMLSDSNVGVNIGGTTLDSVNPRIKIGEGGSIEVITNGRVDFNLV